MTEAAWPPPALLDRLGHPFADPMWIERALTHRSWANEHDALDNERLEFLGDAILSAALTPLLLARYPIADEGQLARLRSRLVKTATLARIARDLDLGEGLRIGRGEERTGGRDKASVLEDALEAVVGAIFLDGGFAAAEGVVHRWFDALVDEYGVEVETWNDPVSALQEATQARRRGTPRYVEVDATGPDHDPQFEVAVHLGDDALATGHGRSKKAARRAAAAAALAILDAEEDDA